MSNTKNPCLTCADKNFCRGICRDKQKYIRSKSKLIIDKNKNGIRRERRIEL